MARYGQSVVRSTSIGPGTGTLSRPRYAGQRPWAVAEAYRQTVAAGGQVEALGPTVFGPDETEPAAAAEAPTSRPGRQIRCDARRAITQIPDSEKRRFRE
ncbi:hypothetical protein GCM10009609_39850 [Pseudonocardia aurantiaca]